MVRSSFVVAILVLIGACATNNVPVVTYETDPYLKNPPVGLFNLRPNADFRDECQAWHEKLMHYCNLNTVPLDLVRQELSASNLFEAVGLAEDAHPYSIAISTAHYSRETAGDLAEAVVSGATLLLVPTTVDATLKARAFVLWNDIPIKQFDYELPMKLRMGLGVTVNTTDRDMARSLASHVARDIANAEDLFRAEYLHEKLESSDYTQDLYLPAQLGGFRKGLPTLNHHPFVGVMTRYYHADHEDVLFDTYVYPVRDWRLDPSTQVGVEAERVRLDIDLMAKQGHLKNVELGETNQLEFSHDEFVVPVAHFNGRYVREAQPLETSAYVWIQGDKVVKVRASFPPQFVEGSDLVAQAVSALVQEVRVPPESMFMANIRKGWRDSGPSVKE